MHDGRYKAYDSVQVIPRDCLGRLTLWFAWNSRNAKDIMLTLHGGYRESEEVYISATSVSGDVAFELLMELNAMMGIHNATSCL